MRRLIYRVCIDDETKTRDVRGMFEASNAKTN